MIKRLILATVFAAAIPFSAAYAQRPTFSGPLLNGYLCCNMRSYGDSVSDINYDEAKQPLAIGAPVQITVYERHWFDASMGGKSIRFKNDYSREMSMSDFAKRYVVNEDPALKLAAYEPPVREAIKAGRLLPGMSRDQVVMSLGWPIVSENPKIEAASWRYLSTPT